VAKGKAAVTKSFLLAGTTEEDKHFEPEKIEVAETLEPLAAQSESK
jgi:hypothetical protein